MKPLKAHTISKEGNAMVMEKGSKFFGFAYGVNNLADIQYIISNLKSLHPKATHHCYAFVLGKKGDIYKTNDDGEPAHSAGDPILGQIRSASLINTLVVVVRYYGGTKLGVGGLISAYRQTAKGAIERAEKKLWIEAATFLIQFSYPQQKAIDYLGKQIEWELIESKYAELIHYKVSVTLDHIEQLKTSLQNHAIVFTESN